MEFRTRRVWRGMYWCGVARKIMSKLPYKAKHHRVGPGVDLGDAEDEGPADAGAEPRKHRPPERGEHVGLKVK